MKAKIHFPSSFTWILLILIAGSCSNMRYLEEGQQLYTGSDIKIESEEKIKNKSEVSSELSRVIRPQPNNRFLVWRPRLWFYNVAGEDPSTRLGKWLRNNVGRPPVLWEDFSMNRSLRLMENRLFNMGFFDPQITYDINEKKNKASVDFVVSLKPAFTINEIFFIESDDAIATNINESKKESLIKPGETYSLSLLREERGRIARHLRDLGYYYFQDDFLLFRADTSVAERTVDLRLTIKPNTPSNALRKYKIRNVYVTTTHSLHTRDEQQVDTLEMDNGLYLVNNQDLFKPHTIKNAVFFVQDKEYSTRDHDLTLNHLMGLGVFQFVNLRFIEVENDGKSALDVRILLTPMDKKTLSAELRGVTKSTGFTGPGMSLSFSNRNFLSGAENFILKLDGAFETLIGQGERRTSSLEAGASAELSVPRFIVPFSMAEVSSRYIPQTRMLLSFNFMNRTDAFSVSSIRSQFGYEWRQSVTSSYRLYPFIFNVFSLGTVSEQYEEFFSQEVLLRRGLFEQFILGSEFSYTWNTQLYERRKHAWYFNINLDMSGNIAYLLIDGLNLGTQQEEGGYGILNQSFSQFSKTDFDLRYYLDIGNRQKIVTRVAAGIGIPYGNSTTLPYVKLFTTGGSNSIRAFHPRSLGPGSYTTPEERAGSFDIYQSGDIKLELNAEYRVSFNNVIKGALFADAGNVWNINEREGAPGGKFDSDLFLSQIALGTGVGLRFDFTFFILRFDLAFPLAVPYDGSESYFQSIKPLDGSWRRNNLLLNLAIGYPF